FFVAFNLMEALLPSLISKESPAGYKGTAMGVYSTSQFLGVAISVSRSSSKTSAINRDYVRFVHVRCGMNA
ncbi:hypothetical protein CXF12_07905, partial [Escherichia coli]